MTEKPKILVVDDEFETRDIFKRYLEKYYDVTLAESAEEALNKMEQQTFHIALTDLVMPKTDGLELLSIIKKKHPHISVVVISGKASIKTAVEAMKCGAEDFVEKPVDDLELLNLIIDKIMKSHWQAKELNLLRNKIASDFEAAKVIGNSLPLQKIIEKVRIIAPLDTTVVITGETGTGKELFAELIYRNSKRRNKKFVAINCGSLPETLLESTLFGHKKGAFTDASKDKIGYFQEADGGTLFLDEITETSTAFQTKLLRVLEKESIRQVGGENDIKVNVRIITASNKKLEDEVEKGSFREDLYYRLNVLNITIPPLRERIDDIPLLANFFIKEFSKKHRKAVKGISEPTLAILLKYDWKGNVRELKNTIEHSVAMTSHNLIIPEDLPSNIYKSEKYPPLIEPTSLYDLPFAASKEEFEKHYLDLLMKKTKGEVTAAADLSGIKRQNLYEKFSRYQINPDSYRK